MLRRRLSAAVQAKDTAHMAAMYPAMAVVEAKEIEDIVGTLPAVALVAVIAREHPKWGERPVLSVEPRRNQVLTEALILATLRGKVPDWWLPDRVVFIEHMPLAATGKIDKRRLRDGIIEP